MALILDTCTAIWVVAGEKLALNAEQAIGRARTAGEAIYVSAITAWEVGLLATRGRFASPLSPQAWFTRLLSQDPVQMAALTPSALIESCFLPGRPPRDPADRIIIATARELELTIVTRDRLILGYAEAGNVRALPC